MILLENNIKGGYIMKKFFKLILSTIVAFSVLLSSNNIVKANSINIAAFRDWDFTWRSAVEPLVLDMDADTVSFYATCDGDEVDTLTCIIVDISHNGAYSSSFPFEADGSVTTYAAGFPEGRYKIYFVGDADINKSLAMAVFSMFTD